MRPVVSDAGPLHYLILIEAVESLPALFGRVIVPALVAVELSHPATPSSVRAWLAAAPDWLERRPAPVENDIIRLARGAGERAAIELALSVGARLLLIDDRAGAVAATARGLETIGTLGALVRAAQLGLVDLAAAFSRLREANFRCRLEFLAELLATYGSAS